MVCHEKICQDYKLSMWDGYKQHLFVLTGLSSCYNVMIGGTSSLPWGGWLHLSIPGTPISDHPAVGVSLQEKWWSPLMHPSKLFMRLNHLWMVLVNLHTKHRNICLWCENKTDMHWFFSTQMCTSIWLQCCSLLQANLHATLGILLKYNNKVS